MRFVAPEFSVMTDFIELLLSVVTQHHITFRRKEASRLCGGSMVELKIIYTAQLNWMDGRKKQQMKESAAQQWIASMIQSEANSWH